MKGKRRYRRFVPMLLLFSVIYKYIHVYAFNVLTLARSAIARLGNGATEIIQRERVAEVGYMIDDVHIHQVLLAAPAVLPPVMRLSSNTRKEKDEVGESLHSNPIPTQTVRSSNQSIHPPPPYLVAHHVRPVLRQEIWVEHLLPPLVQKAKRPWRQVDDGVPCVGDPPVRRASLGQRGVDELLSRRGMVCGV